MLIEPPPFSVVFACLAIATVAVFFMAKRRVASLAAGSGEKPHSLLIYYGFYAAIWVFIPPLILLLAWLVVSPSIAEVATLKAIMAAYPDLPPSFQQLKFAQVQNIASGVLQSSDEVLAMLAAEYRAITTNLDKLGIAVILILALGCFIFAYRRLSTKLKSRVLFEKFLRWVFFAAAIIAIFTTIGIVMSLLFEALRFFAAYNFFDFIFGTHWAPNVAMRDGANEDVGGASGSFGMVPVMAGTLLVATIAMLVAVPVGLFSAIYMAEFASPRVRNWIKPTLEMLAGIPTVVYGFFAALTAAPFFRAIGLNLGMDVSSQSALAAGGVMGVMIIPFISSLSDDVITAVPAALRDGAYGLGSTKGEVITKVVLPAALPGLVGAFLLGISRAFGETMIVVMAAGVAANLTANPLESVTTVTVQIVLLLTGDTVFDSPKTLSAFALGMTLFAVTLFLNIAALTVARRLGEKYD